MSAQIFRSGASGGNQTSMPGSVRAVLVLSYTGPGLLLPQYEQVPYCLCFKDSPKTVLRPHIVNSQSSYC